MVDLHDIRITPDEFLGSSSVRNSKGCDIFRKIVHCSIPSILSDGERGPLEPDVTRDDDRRHFVAWNSRNPFPDIVLTPNISPLLATGVELSILNSPRDRIGIPNFTIYGMNSPYSGVELEYDVVNNQFLTQNDTTVQQIILNISNPQPYVLYELKWNFTNLYNIDWFLLSEILLLHRDILFSLRSSGTIMDTPTFITSNSGHVLPDGSIRLNCTIRGHGLYKWTWTFNGSAITNMEMYTADMTRTGILIVPHTSQTNQLYGRYRCMAQRKLVLAYSKEYTLAIGECDIEVVNV